MWRAETMLEPFLSLRGDAVSAYGRDGGLWFDTLPLTISDAVKRFGLTGLGQVRRGSMSLLIDAEVHGTVPAVLKIVFPNPESRIETDVLVRAAGHGYVRLIDAEPKRGVSILERLPTGVDFYGAGPQSDREAIRAIAQCVANMWHGGTDDFEHFPSAETWAGGFHSVTKTHDVSVPVGFTRAEIVEAHLEFIELLRDSRDTRVLHGDLHHGNIMLDNSANPIAIDPKGVIGPLCYEFGAFLRNPAPALITWPDPVATIIDRTEFFAEEFGLDPSTILRWSVAQLALSAVWASEDSNHAWARYAAGLKPIMRDALETVS